MDFVATQVAVLGRLLGKEVDIFFLLVPVGCALGLLSLLSFYTTLTLTQYRARFEALLAICDQKSEMIEKLLGSCPMVISEAFFARLQGATFCILDTGGHPVCLGFFVTPCGVALTAASACKYARSAGGGVRAVHASTHTGQEFLLQIVTAKVGALDVAVLRVPPAAATGGGALLLPRDHLPLPPVRLSSCELFGMPVTLIHGSIAWSVITTPRHTARDNGYVSCSSDSLLHCRVPSYRGHAGGVLLFHDGKLLGLHTESWQSREGEGEGEEEHSLHTSYTTRADAVRLDTPQIKEAVAAAMGAAAAAPTGAAASALGGARRRTRSNGALLEGR